MKTSPQHNLAHSIAATIAIVASQPAERAQACGECLCAERAPRLRPSLTREAPTNYQPLLLLPPGASTDAVKVTDSTGATIGFSLAPIDEDARARWLSPLTRWDPGESYQVQFDDQPLGSFDVVDEGDVAAPAIEAVALTGEGSSALCTRVRGGVLTIGRASDTRFYDLVAVLAVAGETLVFDIYGTRDQSYPFGDGWDDATCLGLAQGLLPETGPLDASLDVFDMAGNATHVEGLRLDALGEISPASCPTSPSSSGDPTFGPTDEDGGAPAPSEEDAARPDADVHVPDRLAPDPSSTSGCAASGPTRRTFALPALLAVALLVCCTRRCGGRSA